MHGHSSGLQIPEPSVWFCLQNQGPQQKSTAVLSSPFALTFQQCHSQPALLPPMVPFSSSDPAEVWVEPDDPAMGLFWIERRRGEFQLCGLLHPLPALALLLARMLQLASSGFGQHGLGTSTDQRIAGCHPALTPANVRQLSRPSLAHFFLFGQEDARGLNR